MTVRRMMILGAITTALAVLTIQPAVSQTNGEKLQITAFAVNVSNIGTGQTATVDFTIDRWSTEQERTRLVTTMLEKGQDQLLEMLRGMRSHGKLRVPALNGPDPLNLRTGWDLKYAWQEKLPEGGRRIVLATDRVMSFWELRNSPRTVDYPFTVVEMRVDRNGDGEGKLSVATKIRFDNKKNVIELENFASEPVRLQQVKVKATS
jgi:hypothetical protein